MKIIGAVLLIVVLGIVGVVDWRFGFQTERPAAPVAPKVIAIIGLTECGKWMGGIAVDSNGGLHGSIDLTPEQAQAIAKTLPPENNMVASAPCGTAEGTKT